MERLHLRSHFCAFVGKEARLSGLSSYHTSYRRFHLQIKGKQLFGPFGFPVPRQLWPSVRLAVQFHAKEPALTAVPPRDA